MQTQGFIQAIAKDLEQQTKHNKISLEKLAAKYGIADKNLVKELTELAIVQTARKLAHQPGSVIERYNNIVQLYESQVNLSHRTSQSVLLQQYSTPAPIAYLMGVYCGIEQPGEYLEPSAGNGLLTIAGSVANFSVNEIDTVRNQNLQAQDYQEVTKLDATQVIRSKTYDAILTNPPFGKLNEPVEIDGYLIKDLDHLMAIRALQNMKDNGRAAIIIGGHTTWDEHGRITAGKNRIFFNYLHKHYQVEDTIQIDGKKLYTRQGTGFPVRLILINGRKKVAEGVAPLRNDADVVVSSFQELFNRVTQLLSSSTSTMDLKLRLKLKAKAIKLKLAMNNNLSGHGNDFTTKVKAFIKNGFKTTDRKPLVAGYPEAPLHVLDPDKPIILTYDVLKKAMTKDDEHSLTEDQILKLPEAINNPIIVFKSDAKTALPNSYVVITEIIDKNNQTVMVAIQISGWIQNLKGNKIQTAFSKTSAKILNDVRLAIHNGRVEFWDSDKTEKWLRKNGELQLLTMLRNHFPSYKYTKDLPENNGEELGMPYLPASQLCNSLQVDTPDSMGYEIHAALQKLKQKVGAIEIYVQHKLGYQTQDELCQALSAEQADAAALAIYNIEHRNQALIVGDQTGIGKGRIAASIIRYGVKQGLKPIFITEKPNLFSDIYRDLKAIGSETIKPYIVNARDSKSHIKDEDGNVVFEALDADQQKKIIASGNLPSEFNCIMLTYSQISGGEVNRAGNLVRKSPKGEWVELQANGNIVILDEAHNASGDSNTGKVLQDIVRNTKGVTFLSATFAKRPDNMPIYALKTAISEANMSKSDLIEGIEKGGVALQEVLSAQLVQHGQMIRRERSYEGIEVNYITLDEKAQEHRAISDNITNIIRDIIAFQKKYIDGEIEALDAIAAKTNTGSEVEKRKGTKDAGVDATPYFSKVFQVVNQMLFAIKAEAVTDRAIMRLREGKKAVIAFSSTMGSFLESMTDADGTPAEDGKKINADFATVLQKGLDGVLRYTERGADGKSIYKMIDVNELSIEAQQEYSRIATDIQNISSGIVISPIDLVKQRLTEAGYRVAEVTGRKLAIDLKFEKQRTIGLVKSRKRENANDAFRKFQNNEVDVLMINQSGSTGASAHAIPTKVVSKHQVKQRVMILLQAELDINTEVQKRGRINRTGQIYKPIYDYMFSAIPAEKRLMMMLQKKLKSLDANTASNQKQSEAILSVDDFLNKIGDRIVTQYLSDNLEFNEMLGDPIKLFDSDADSGKNGVVEDAAHRVSGRVAVLPTILQEKFYNDILQLYRDEVEYLKQIDEYDLEVDVLNLQATTLSKEIVIVGKGGSSAFGDNTYLEQCEVNLLRKPYTVNELDNLYLQATQDKSPEAIQQEWIQALQNYSQTQTQKVTEQIEQDYIDRMLNIHHEKNFAKLDTEEQKQFYVNTRTKELQEAKSEKQQKEQQKIANRFEALGNNFKFFSIGRKIYYPLDMENASSNKSIAVSLGIKIDVNSDKAFVPSNIKLIIAIASAKKRIDIPLSKVKDINAIIGISAQLSEVSWDFVKDEWSKAIKENTTDRGIAYIVTGNLLQSYGSDQFAKGRLISYTTSDGKTRKGRLMPDGWEQGTAQNDKLVKVPISKAVKVIASLTAGKSISTDADVIIVKTYDDTFKMMIPAAKSSGGDLYLDAQLNELMDTGRFDKISNYMTATFPMEKLQTVCDTLQRNHNASVSLTPYQLQLLSDIHTEEKEEEFISLELQQKIEAEREARNNALPEPPPTPAFDEVQALKLRLSLKAKAIKLKLKLAA
ncbi:MAG: strawberry notch-like NTP hydrolase domain-containing protein [Chryseotalea sp.]